MHDTFESVLVLNNQVTRIHFISFLQVDCPDSSDEKDCDVLEVPSDYRSQIFPITASGDPLLVTVNVTILAFPEIHTLELSYTVDFVLLMQWIDPRLALNQIPNLN